MNALTLDRLLARYGPDTSEIRGALKRAVAILIDLVWRQGSSRPAHLDSIRSGATAAAERVPDATRILTWHNDPRRALQSRALDLAEWIVTDG